MMQRERFEVLAVLLILLVSSVLIGFDVPGGWVVGAILLLALSAAIARRRSRGRS